MRSLLSVLLLSSFFSPLHAYPGGAPTASCGLGLPLSVHPAYKTNDNKISIAVTLNGQAVTTYMPSTVYQVTFTAPSGSGFNAFVAGANPSTGSGSGGSLSTSDTDFCTSSCVLACSGLGDHITQRADAVFKNTLSATWTTPSASVGPISLQVGVLNDPNKSILVGGSITTLVLTPIPSVLPTTNVCVVGGAANAATTVTCPTGYTIAAIQTMDFWVSTAEPLTTTTPSQCSNGVAVANKFPTCHSSCASAGATCVGQASCTISNPHSSCPAPPASITNPASEFCYTTDVTKTAGLLMAVTCVGQAATLASTSPTQVTTQTTAVGDVNQNGAATNAAPAASSNPFSAALSSVSTPAWIFIAIGALVLILGVWQAVVGFACVRSQRRSNRPLSTKENKVELSTEGNIWGGKNHLGESKV